MTKTIKWAENPELQARFDQFVAEGLTLAQCADRLNAEYPQYSFNENVLSRRRYNMKQRGIKPILKHYFEEVQDDIDEIKNLTVEHKSTGEIATSGDVYLDDTELITSDTLLNVFGYDPDEFEVVSSSSTAWDGMKVGGKRKMYRCKINVKRKVVPLSIDKIAEIVGKVEPVEVERKYVSDQDGNTLVIPMYDKHFGISDLKHYESELAEINTVQSLDGIDTTIIALGGDLFHNDSVVHGATTKGTLIDKVDMFEAIRDFRAYFDAIMVKALEHSREVIVVSVAGNHDTTIGYMVSLMLAEKYPQATWHIAKNENDLWRKAIVVNDIMFCFAHGDKARKNIDRVFANDFHEEWGKCETREIFVGHLHSNKQEIVLTENTNGVTIRQMPSMNKLDGYHVFNGYTGSRPQSKLYYYRGGKIKDEIYVN